MKAGREREREVTFRGLAEAGGASCDSLSFDVTIMTAKVN